jgi:hypothetical protein
MGLNLPRQATPSQTGPQLGNKAVPSSAQGSAAPAQPGQKQGDPNDNIPVFIEQNMMKATPEEQDLVKQAITSFPPLADVFGIMIAPQAREYVLAIQQKLSQGDPNSQGAPAMGAPTPENAPMGQAPGAQPAMATPQAPQGM